MWLSHGGLRIADSRNLLNRGAIVTDNQGGPWHKPLTALANCNWGQFVVSLPGRCWPLEPGLCILRLRREIGRVPIHERVP
ncbi:hypothetical protein RPPS3_41470 [Rhodopseudomonas palustris]|nr:hypothetical protein RPPS3_41470 [Rhodopseudomonas palustris]